jgi:tRNA U34 5-methylaminomethyl-2-thiouridine-forming methyltransferase MnmC
MQNEMNQIKRELQVTADGSHTLFIPEMDEHYHSVNGAVQESRHVFIEAGLHQLEREDITVLK